MGRRRSPSPTGMAVLSAACAVIWTILVITRWREGRLDWATGAALAVWLLNAALWGFRAYQIKQRLRGTKKSEEEAS